MQRISPCLWFDFNGEEAAKFYVKIFKRSKIVSISHYGEGEPGPKGKVMVVYFKLDGQDFIALNGGPQFPFTEAISLSIECKTQKEVDDYWRKLLRGGGKEVQCGWLKDKFGVSWQIVPEMLPRLSRSKNKKKVASLRQAMLKMVKLDIKKLQQAFDRG